MEELMTLTQDYSVEALRLYQILKTENNEPYLARKILTNGLESGLLLRSEAVISPEIKDKLKKYNVEMAYLLEVIKASGCFSDDIFSDLYRLTEQIGQKLSGKEEKQ